MANRNISEEERAEIEAAEKMKQLGIQYGYLKPEKELWLSWQNNTDKLRLPIIPSSYEVAVDSLNTTVNIQELGDINLIGKSGLKEMQIETFFPNQDYAFCQYSDFPTPHECVEMIEKWRLSEKPIRIIITGTPVNLAMGIEKFSWREQDGTGDIYFALDLREYIFTNIRSQSAKKDLKEPEKDKSSTSKISPTTDKKREVKDIKNSYKVKAGDTLWKIAKSQTGNGDNFRAIAKKNNISNPNVIRVGQVIKL